MFYQHTALKQLLGSLFCRTGWCKIAEKGHLNRKLSKILTAIGSILVTRVKSCDWWMRDNNCVRCIIWSVTQNKEGCALLSKIFFFFLPGFHYMFLKLKCAESCKEMQFLGNFLNHWLLFQVTDLLQHFYISNVQKQRVKQKKEKLCNKGEGCKQVKYTYICITKIFFYSDWQN